MTRDQPALYSLPVIDQSSALFCTGHQFDALANNLSEGWACAAVRAVDQVGNIGVSLPLQFFVDYTEDGVPTYDINDMPNCTGTWDPVSQTASPATPCLFDTDTQQFRANTVIREDL